MIEVEIGKYKISKKGVLLLIVLCFDIGLVIGGVLLASANYLIAYFFIAIFLVIFYPMIKKEITTIKKS